MRSRGGWRGSGRYAVGIVWALAAGVATTGHAAMVVQQSPGNDPAQNAATRSAFYAVVGVAAPAAAVDFESLADGTALDGMSFPGGMTLLKPPSGAANVEQGARTPRSGI